ncbi:hypothetical protein KUV85_03035 [Nocardioides panacisoli]|uniref:MacS family sensor histidine kinase n=1 Tax=Nocardioides panacisoli TaxID=627624 RepID=UPI001C626588|nr:DUF5931 domain-containing protein [Nocardioides panacisoli]QYJ04671.1 hypothetical protein KUV85_03035 [Nocardioides panacisoli]
MSAPATRLRASLAVEDRLFAALAVVRVVVLANAVGLNAYRANFERPALAWSVLAAMAVWTGLVIWWCARADRRSWPLLAVDLALAVGALAITPFAKGEWFDASIPGFWVVGALLAWAARYGWHGGLAAAVLLGATDLLARDDISQGNVGQVFLLLLAGPMIGFVSESLKQLAGERDVAQREAAAAEERVRLGRVVHDGVLQVLALVQRRGTEVGGEMAELGRLAGEQETALRNLIRSQDSVAPDTDDGYDDLAAALGALAARPGVEVAVPSGPVRVPARTAAELVGVVGACLDNVARHVGEGAPAWVLVEDLPDCVALSVRDEGPGIPEGRLNDAAAEGRLGVSESIRGRIRDLGGTAQLSTGDFGTEWEFEVPK